MHTMRAHLALDILVAMILLGVAGGCALEDTEIAIDELRVAPGNVRVSGGSIAPIRVITPAGTSLCEGACAYNVALGRIMTVEVTRTFDEVGCLAFAGWSGTCESETEACTFPVMGYDSVRPIWVAADRDPAGRPCEP